ncbi:hypothetical protein QWM81_13030 [Streptomyces ficellus]|uniref:YCII-related domain-containing protein n=1 Tax=Streptomyces ficellus TaxID=1977088 RepID=A0ABT7Z633_9ACTN|nr:hypothetical protein [Streptomyces ficellus]MDN3294959.1 hypothetical protein [Streptomyces ficellus]
MYLIHAQLAAVSSETLPENAADAVMQCALPEESVEHVAAHPWAASGPVLGLFLLSASLAEAERSAHAVCTRALKTAGEFQGFRLITCQAALPPLPYELLLGDGRGTE